MLPAEIRTEAQRNDRLAYTRVRPQTNSINSNSGEHDGLVLVHKDTIFEMPADRT
jgi:hypothetical protein